YQRSSEPPPGMSVNEESAAAPTFAVAALKPLSPEQLAWSVMRGLSIVASARQQAEQGLDGNDPRMRAILQTDAKRRSLRVSLIEEAAHDQLQGGVAPFVSQFAAAAGQPQDAAEPTVHQALFLSNGQPLASWLSTSGSNLLARLGAIPDSAAVAEELYLSLYS